MKLQHSRRTFLKDSGTLLSSSWVTLNMPLIIAAGQTACSRRESGAQWINLSADEAAGLGAVADQIIPPDETVGASDAGVVYFIDAALSGFMSGAAPMLREGLDSLNQAAQTALNTSGGFPALTFDAQTAALKSIEHTPFFRTMLFLTRVGMFALPEHGGNREHAGWELIGFDHRHAWQPPFGYYDELYTEGEGEGEVGNARS